MKDTLINIVQKLLKKNQIYFDKEELSFQIKSHPSYPSLHAITGVLDHFNIENIAAQIPINSQTIKQLPHYFIAQISNKKEEDLVGVEKRKNSTYIIFNSENKVEKISEETFLKKFTGVILVVEKQEKTSSISNSKNLVEYFVLGLFSLSIVYFMFNTTSSIYHVSYLLLSLIGAIISLAITKQELGLQTSIGNAFCNNSNNQKDCDAVLTSKGAEIIKGYKLSDISLLYFSILTINTFIQITNPTLSFLISLLAIPMTIYSLYYQYKIIKKWCSLCLSIIGVLWLQATIPVITKGFISEFILNDVIIFTLISTGSLLIFNYLKPLFTEVDSLRKDKIEGVKFKKNFTLFEAMLSKSPLLDTSINNSKEIIFGNLKANLEIVIVTNPFCGHCKPVHKQINQILQKYSGKVKVIIRFNINTKKGNNNDVIITSKLLEINKEKGEKECLSAMGEIYEEGNIQLWLKKWGNVENIEHQIMELKKESIWCRKNEINFTPEILINGYSFPKEYNTADLLFFIEDLDEKYNQVFIPIKEVSVT
ncbi:vitamin K epoxide reductase family protein [Tenacibaculum sp.]|nr:vitamin K epoxide reductase family protein [Tenacibaculum sp.]